MNRPFLRLPSIALWLGVWAASLSATGSVAAQGFASVSGGATTTSVPTPPASPTPSTPSSVVAVPPRSSASTPSVPTAPVAPASAGLDPPAAQLAALAFTSGSSVAGQAPSTESVSAPTGGSGGAGPNASYEQADKVLVDKSDRRLYLLKRGRVIAEYPIKLGLNPYGHKQREGDFRTPEGKYTLNRRNPNSEFFLGIQISYPNREDAAWARENGNSPGGLIMIHGQPNVPKKPPEHYATRDWTDGCIALSNADMVDVWLRTTVGLPIEIRP